MNVLIGQAALERGRAAAAVTRRPILRLRTTFLVREVSFNLLGAGCVLCYSNQGLCAQSAKGWIDLFN